MTDTADSSAEAIRVALDRNELAAARRRAAVARLRGLMESDVLAIQYLALAGPLSLGELSARLQMSSGGSTALVQRLEREGCVIREPDPGDARSTLLRLTPHGQQRVAAALEPFVDDIDALTGELAADQRAAVAALLERIADAAERRADELMRRADTAVAQAAGHEPALWA